MEETLMLGVGSRRVSACASRDRLDAFAFAVAEDPQCVHSKRFATLLAAERVTDSLEVTHEALLRSCIHQARHSLLDHADARQANFLASDSPTDRNDPLS